MIPRERPASVRDKHSWAIAVDLDDNGHGLSQWEADFLESTLQKLLSGQHLTWKHKQKLEAIHSERVTT